MLGFYNQALLATVGALLRLLQARSWVGFRGLGFSMAGVRFIDS